MPLSVAPSERSLDRLGDRFDGDASAASSVVGRKALDADAGRRAVDLEIEMFDLADGEALEADGDRQLHFDQPLVRVRLEAIGRRDVAIFHEPREIEAHVLTDCQCADVAGGRECDREYRSDCDVAASVEK